MSDKDRIYWKYLEILDVNIQVIFSFNQNFFILISMNLPLNKILLKTQNNIIILLIIPIIDKYTIINNKYVI